MSIKSNTDVSIRANRADSDDFNNKPLQVGGGLLEASRRRGKWLLS